MPRRTDERRRSEVSIVHAPNRRNRQKSQNEACQNRARVGECSRSGAFSLVRQDLSKNTKHGKVKAKLTLQPVTTYSKNKHSRARLVRLPASVPVEWCRGAASLS